MSPFSLSELTGLIRAQEVEDRIKRYEQYSIPPFVVGDPALCPTQEKAATEMRKALQKHNDDVKHNLTQLSLNSGTTSDLLGGVCSAQIGLTGILRGYFREIFAEDVLRFRSNGQVFAFSRFKSWIERELGLRSRHRTMRRSGEPLIDEEKDFLETKGRHTNFESYLNDEDHVLAMTNLSEDCYSLKLETASMKGMLDHLENLHHASVPFVDGLTVELLEFQRQSVQWALERETTPGGVQSFLWAKLPYVAEPGHDLYFNPILERFSKDKPRLARGGIIAEEMGLGKTVISLALILQNPAPEAPLSGSPVTVLGAVGTGNDASSDGPTSWDKELYSRTSASNNKRGSIICRGTLVVVSDDPS